jgi:hypothetical protein
MIVGPTKKENAMRTWQQAAMNQEHKPSEPKSEGLPVVETSLAPMHETGTNVNLEDEDTGDIIEVPTRDQIIAKIYELDNRLAEVESRLLMREKAPSDSLPPVFSTKEEFVNSHIAQLIESRVLDSEDATAIEARKELLGREYDGVFCKS